ncbi:ATP-binding protein [Haliangium ochraceum]|uniref:AAA ATPase central domain protein n=1 Tax=Haliangium ochraceum (strain DSM 14365 / JCM 11303 / SMP-2) TaxID=502025 RepID=D0LHH3_HALO1|nr:ATP-binding protein [Haliangium ochraceum]ACY12835.1 AAA ATPase central domain protein [Haliangium ochraceum DSM 14365]
MRPRVDLCPLGGVRAVQNLRDQSLVLMGDGDDLRSLLERVPALSLAPLDSATLATALAELRLEVHDIDELDADTPLYRPPLAGATQAPGAGLARAESVAAIRPVQVASATEDAAVASARPAAAPPVLRAAAPGAAARADGPHPDTVSEDDAVAVAYGDAIEEIASYLRAGLSVLVLCDKLVVRHLWPRIVRAAVREPLHLDPSSAQTTATAMSSASELGPELSPASNRPAQLDRLRDMLASMKRGQVMVLPHLDLLGAGGERGLSNEARTLARVLYEWPDRLLLGFADHSLPLAPVIAERFAIRPELRGVPREVPAAEGARQVLGRAMLTAEEAAHFADYDAGALFKNVAGLNPVRLRHAVAYAVHQARARGHDSERPAPSKLLIDAIRAFKIQTSSSFEIPEVRMDDIGGYSEVKRTLGRAIDLIGGAWQLPDEALRSALIPRGFLLHGPPGTGKTLFAKAVAHRLDAAIRVVSGPEVTDMFVGESERNLREIFAEARRNAPSVLVFDEFDAIAASRSGRADGGSRAGNAMVAQILTEMDGFRPDVPMLIIGTTNRLELIDEALLRPSRFQAISVGLPDLDARRQIAAIHAARFHIQVAPEQLQHLAAISTGMNGDQLSAVFRDACLGLHCQRPPIAFDNARMKALVDALRVDPRRRRDGVHSKLDILASKEVPTSPDAPSPPPPADAAE